MKTSVVLVLGEDILLRFLINSSTLFIGWHLELFLFSYGCMALTRCGKDSAFSLILTDNVILPHSLHWTGTWITSWTSRLPAWFNYCQHWLALLAYSLATIRHHGRCGICTACCCVSSSSACQKIRVVLLDPLYNGAVSMIVKSALRMRMLTFGQNHSGRGLLSHEKLQVSLHNWLLKTYLTNR